MEDKGNLLLLLSLGLIGAVLVPDLFTNKRAKALRKARAAKRRYARTGRKPARRSGGKKSKAEIKAQRLRNLAKARRALKRKKK